MVQTAQKKENGNNVIIRKNRLKLVVKCGVCHQRRGLWGRLPESIFTMDENFSRIR